VRDDAGKLVDRVYLIARGAVLVEIDRSAEGDGVHVFAAKWVESLQLNQETVWGE